MPMLAAFVLADTLNKSVAISCGKGSNDACEEGVLVERDVGFNDVLRGFSETINRVDAGADGRQRRSKCRGSRVQRCTYCR